MKKIIAILLCAMLMLSCLAVVAESGIMPLTDKCQGECSFRTVSVEVEYTNACTAIKRTYQECTVCGYTRTVQQRTVNHVGDKIDGRCSECGGKWN